MTLEGVTSAAKGAPCCHGLDDGQKKVQNEEMKLQFFMIYFGACHFWITKPGFGVNLMYMASFYSNIKWFIKHFIRWYWKNKKKTRALWRCFTRLDFVCVRWKIRTRKNCIFYSWITLLEILSWNRNTMVHPSQQFCLVTG